MKNNTKFSFKVQKELNKNLEIGSKISLILGSIGLFIYIVLGVINETEPVWLNYILYPAAILFGFGLVFLITVNKTNKSANIFNTENNYEFSEEYFTIESIKNGEIIANVKVYYNEITKFKQTESYIFIYHTVTTAYPVEKLSMQKNEIDTLISYLKNGVAEHKKQLKRK